jgi:hypothetical protein
MFLTTDFRHRFEVQIEIFKITMDSTSDDRRQFEPYTVYCILRQVVVQFGLGPTTDHGFLQGLREAGVSILVCFSLICWLLGFGAAPFCSLSLVRKLKWDEN